MEEDDLVFSPLSFAFELDGLPDFLMPEADGMLPAVAGEGRVGAVGAERGVTSSEESDGETDDEREKVEAVVSVAEVLKDTAWPIANPPVPHFPTVRQPMGRTVQFLAGSALRADVTPTSHVPKESGLVNLRLWKVFLKKLDTSYEFPLFFLSLLSDGRFKSHRDPTCPNATAIKYVCGKDCVVRSKESQCECKASYVDDVVLPGVVILWNANALGLYSMVFVDEFNTGHGIATLHMPPPPALPGAPDTPQPTRTLLMTHKRTFESLKSPDPAPLYCTMEGCCFNNLRSDMTRPVHAKAEASAAAAAAAAAKHAEREAARLAKAEAKALEKRLAAERKEQEKRERALAKLVAKAEAGPRKKRRRPSEEDKPAAGVLDVFLSPSPVIGPWHLVEPEAILI